MSALIKRSFTLAGHRTSIALEPEFWSVLESLALSEERSLVALIAALDSERPAERPLASVLRVHALLRAR